MLQLVVIRSQEAESKRAELLELYKSTGFDLRRFEDSMLFKLAWLMYKERRMMDK
jgi:hypothetical protein